MAKNRVTDSTPTPAVPRRSLAGGAAALLGMAGAATPTPAFTNPDAELIQLCAAYVAEMRQYCSVGQHTWNMLLDNPEWIRCHEIGCAMVPGLHATEAEITNIPARTLAGLQAKAEAARHQLSGDADRDTEPMDPKSELVWSLVLETLDVLGGREHERLRGCRRA